MPLDFRVRDFAYPSEILRLRRFLEKSQWLPPERLRAYQKQRLKTIVHQAYYHTSYYRRIFDTLRLKPRDIRKIEDLTKIPLLSRQLVRANFHLLRADNATRFRPTAAHTSGTSGTPLTFLVDKPFNILEFVYYWRHWGWAGYRLGDCFAQERYDYFITRKGMMHKAWHFQPHLRRLLLNSLHISRDHIAEYADALRRYRPRFLHGLPTILHSLATFLREEGLNDISFRAVFTGGEKVLPEHRHTIENTFGCKVLDSYGHMERCVAVSQCPHGGYHVNSEYGILQLAHQSQTHNGAVMGIVLSTSLHKMAMPFLRYEVDDLLEMYTNDKRCPCGRTLPLVKAIHGRKRDMILTPDGRLVDWLVAAFDHVTGVRSYQFVQEEVDRLTVRIVRAGDYTTESQETLKLWLRKLIGDAMIFTLEYVSEDHLERDSSGNPRQVVSRLTPQ